VNPTHDRPGAQQFPVWATVPLPGPIETDPTGVLAAVADRYVDAERVDPAGEVARAMLQESLSRVVLGAYDRRIVAWLSGWDQPTIATVASLLRRSWTAGVEDGRGEADTQLRESLTQRDADLDQTARDLAATEDKRRELACLVQATVRWLTEDAAACAARFDAERLSAQGLAERLLDMIRDAVEQLSAFSDIEGLASGDGGAA
jgi:hypothetical protein